MNWLVVWTCVLTSMINCPDESIDPYTGQMRDTGCLVVHLQSHKEVKYQTFETMTEAQQFVKSAPDEVKDKMHIIDIRDKK